MKRFLPFLSGLLMLVLSLPVRAQCGCTAGPCEEVSLQTVAAEYPEETGFGAELSPVTVRRSPGMEIRISSSPRYDLGVFAALMMLGTSFIPIISVVRERMSSTGPLLSLDLARHSRETPGAVDKEEEAVAPAVSRNAEAPRKRSRVYAPSFLPATWS